ncbi:hypothetical protein FRC12_012856 [Ceratobasidium sp. 428]|nr:hypothetical protein FRC12_012856 [Ceratobasidium sp. 428]
MGEFPDPAINGESVSTSASSVNAASSPTINPRPATTTQFTATSPAEAETSTVAEESPTPVTTSTSAIRSSTSEPADRPSQITSLLMPTSMSQTSITSGVASTIPPTSSQFQTSFVMTSTTISLAAIPSTQHSTSAIRGTTNSSSSLAGTTTRPIITPPPTSTFTPTAPAELVTANSHLSFGQIVGLVAIVLGVIGWCVVLGPRRALRKVGIGKKKSWENSKEHEEWDDEGSVHELKRASIAGGSDWWSLRAPAGALGARMSSVSMAGPGMAGVGAGSRMTSNPSEDPSVTDQPPQDVIHSPQAERHGTVRSGWFASSMVRGASLLSLGSVLKPEPAVSRAGPAQGSAGRRFQESYRRERATEMGERTPSTSSRVPYPAVKRPSRLGTVPAILVQDATLPSLSSASHVTGRGYDADVERIHFRQCRTPSAWL